MPDSQNASTPLTAEQQRTLFATKLEALRADKGWTQTELARRASQFSDKPITRDRISKYSLGHSLPGQPHLLAISKALGVSASDLLPPRVVRNLATHPLRATLREDGMAELNINMMVPWELAVAVVKMIREATGSDNAST